MAKTNPEVLHCSQPRSQLCWATCILMVREVILRKQNFDITPEKVYESLVYDSGNTPARDRSIVSGLQRWGVDGRLVQSQATFAEIQNEIDAQRPIIVGLRGVGNSSGHVVVVGGYEMRGPTRWIWVYDPAKNGEEIMPFRALAERIPTWDATFFLTERNVNL